MIGINKKKNCTHNIQLNDFTTWFLPMNYIRWNGNYAFGMETCIILKIKKMIEFGIEFYF